MGLYGADMIIPALLPTALPKFVVVVKYYELVGALAGDLTLNIFTPLDDNKPVQSMPIPRGEQTVIPQLPDGDDGELITSWTIPIVFAPFLIPKEGSIKVRMHCRDTKTNLGRLVIRTRREGEDIKFV